MPYLDSVPAGSKIIVRNHPMSEIGSRAAAVYDVKDAHYERWQKWQEEHVIVRMATIYAGDPQKIAKSHVDTCRKMRDYCVAAGVNPDRLLFEGLNEPQLWAGESPSWTAAYYRQFALDMYANNMHVVVGNFGVGWPGNGGVQDAPVDWTFFKPVIDVLHDGDYLGLHEYWALNGPKENWRWWAGRFLQCPYDVPILITETGIDTGVTGNWYGGWYDLPGNTHDEKAQRYSGELYWYAEQCAKDGRVKGLFPFTYDCEKTWQKFNVRDSVFLSVLLPQIGKFHALEDGTVTPPVDPDVEKEIVGKIALQQPNDGSSYVYGYTWQSGAQVAFAWRGQEAAATTISGPHEGYPNWAPGYYSLPLFVDGKTPCQGQWDIWCSKDGLTSKRVQFSTDGKGGAVNQVQVNFSLEEKTTATLADLLKAEFGSNFSDLHDKLTVSAMKKYATRNEATIARLVLHHTAMAQTGTWEAVAKYHVNTKGWPGIGYHIGIHVDGRVALLNEPNIISYHSGDASKPGDENADSLAIACMGNFETSPVPASLWPLVERVVNIVNIYS